MPKPYHTPRSERDEALAAISEAEQISETEDTCPAHEATYLESERCPTCGAPPCCAPCECEEEDRS